MPFDTYIEKNILEPLGMTQTTTRQPLPARYTTQMSRGYQWKGGDFETGHFMARDSRAA